MRISTTPIGVIAGIVGATMVLASCSTVGEADSAGPADSPAASTEGGELPSACTYTSEVDVPSEVTVPVAGDYEIGYISPMGSNEAASATQAAVEHRVAELGGKVSTFDAKAQPEFQVNGFQQFITQGVDAIIVPAPLDPNALTPMLHKAQDAAIPVITMDAYQDPREPVSGYASNMVLGRDQQAFVQASEMAKRNPGAEVAIIKFAVPVPAIEYLSERTAHWADVCGLDVVATVADPTGEPSGAQGVITPVLQEYPNLKGVLAYNDPAAIGASTAARGLGRTITTIGLNGGSDGFNAVESGQIDMTVQTPQVQYGVTMVDAAYGAIEGISVPRDVLLDPVTWVVTAESIEDGESKTYTQLLALLPGGS